MKQHLLDDALELFKKKKLDDALGEEACKNRQFQSRD